MKLLPALFAPLLLLSPAVADVLVVGSNPGDYANAQQAQLAAAPRDTIYFRPGDHTVPTGSFTVVKPLHFVGSGANTCTLRFQIVLSGNLIGTGETSLSSFRVRGKPHIGYALHLDHCAGNVQLQDLHVDPMGLSPIGVAQSFGTAISASSDVVATNCVFEGRDGQWNLDEGAYGDHGLLVSQGRVVLYGTRVFGGEGGTPGQTHYFAGGAGGGGDAITVGVSTVEHAGCAFVGGESGYSPFSQGPPGQDTRTFSGGALQAMSHARFFFDLPSISVEGTSPMLRAFGPAGTNVFALTSTYSFYRHLGIDFGILHLGGALNATLLGQIPAGGQLAVPFDAPFLVGQPAAQQRIQLLATGAGHRMISDPRIRTIVPPGL